MLPIMYIAGPYRGKTHSYLSYCEIDANINEARKVAIWCASNNIGYFCPHLNSAHMEIMVPNVHVDFLYTMDLQFFPICHAMILLPNWEQSRGTRKEKTLFEVLEKPIFNSWNTEAILIFAREVRMK